MIESSVWKKTKNKKNQIRNISKNLKIKEHIVNNPNQQQKKINVKIDEQVGEGIYSNFFMVTSSPSEFVIDFGRLLPGMPNAKIYSRVLATPQHTKQLLNILQKNVENFEKMHGEIKLPGKQEDKEIGFKATDKILD